MVLYSTVIYSTVVSPEPGTNILDKHISITELTVSLLSEESEEKNLVDRELALIYSAEFKVLWGGGVSNVLFISLPNLRHIGKSIMRL